MINRKLPLGRTIPLGAVIGLTTLITACAAPQNKHVAEARSSYQAIAEDPNVARSGAIHLRKAKTYLERAEELLQEGANEEKINHVAYLADQEAAIAAQQGLRSALQEQLDNAEQRREAMILQMRTLEANRAQMQATQAQQEAQRLRQQMEALQAQPTERGMVLTLGDVLFDLNEADLRPNALRTIDKLAEFLREYENRRVRIEGYTDSTGSEAYNLQLSEERAMSVRDALVNEGISPDRIEVQGYGEAYPVASNSDASGRARNRRVEIVISDDAGNIQSR